MKVVLSQEENYKAIGLASTLASIYANDFFYWNPKEKPVFDLFDELKPDILFLHEQYNNEVVHSALSEYPSTKFIFIGNTINGKGPDAIITWDKELEISIPTFYFRPLVDLINYHSGTVQNKLKTDLIYYSRTPDKEVLDVLGRLSLDFQLKIYGPHRIDLPNYLGFLDTHQISDAFASSKINIDFHETRMEAALSRTISLCSYDCPKQWSRFSDYDDLKEKISLLLQNELEEERQKVGNNLYNFVVSRHTYFHLISEVFSKIGLIEESKKSLSKLEQHI